MTSRKLHSEAQGEATFTCETCFKAFPTKRNLSRHVRRNHTGTKFRCYYCDFDTKFKECLVRHVPLHLVKKDVGGRNHGAYVNCPLCEFGCVVRETMIEHYEKEHDVDMSEKYFEFPNMEEFLKWKYEVEQADVCQFTSRSKKNRGTVQIRYYRCFRDGIFHKKGRGIRNMKLKGSLKINGICPAGFKAEEDRASGVMRVTFIRSHVGHSNELGLMTLSKIERAEIAHKLSMGQTHEDIIGNIRGSIDAEVKRLHLTTFKDVWNVQSSYGLRTKRKKRVKDGKAVKARKKNDHVQIIMPECVLESVPSVAKLSNPDIGNTSSICIPNEKNIVLEHTQQEQCMRMETSGTEIWNIPCQTEVQTESFYTTQSAPEITTVTQNSFDLNKAKNMPVAEHGHGVIETCESSCDNEDQYFEIVTPDMPDDRLIPVGNQLYEKKVKVTSKVHEILESIKTEEQADMLYNELLRIQDAIEVHNSIVGQF